MVVALSRAKVEVSSNFQGTELALFGTIERDNQTVSRAGRYSIAVVVLGPAHDVLVQQKARRFGLWVNASGTRYQSIPSYFAFLTTDQNPATAAEALLDANAGVAPTVHRFVRDQDPYFAAFREQRQAEQRVIIRGNGVAKLTGRFFRAIIPLPGLVDDGAYRVRTILMRDGVVLDTNTLIFRVAKVGLEQTLFAVSRERPLFYGLGVVLLALVTGYVGGVVFRRR